MGWDIILVLAVVALAAWFMGRRLYLAVMKRGCACGKAGTTKCMPTSCPSCRQYEEIGKK